MDGLCQGARAESAHEAGKTPLFRQSFEDRQAERRDKLIHAAVQVAGRVGLDGASVAAICAEAGLTARYFYESFPTREAIFVEAYRAVQNELLHRITEGKGQGDPKRALTGFYN